MNMKPVVSVIKKEITAGSTVSKTKNNSQNHALAAPLLTPALTFLFSLTSALAVANVYFAQPLLESMAKSFSVQSAAIGMVVTMTQVGYGAGLLFIVPLGDIVNRKYLVITQMVLLATALFIAGFSQNWATFLGAMVFVGLMAVVVQIVVVYTASLAAAHQRGKAVGTVTSGVVLGILLARFTSGVIADLAGWRAVYLSAACLMLMMAGVLYKAIPSLPQPRVKSSYWVLIKSVFMLFITEPTLRARGIFALLIFAAFSVLWTSMVLPLSAQSLSHTQIGMFGLAGIAGALAASKAGKWADRGMGQRTTGLSLILLLLSWLPIAFAERSLLLLIVGVIVLDFAVQAVHVTNQSLIFSAIPNDTAAWSGPICAFILWAAHWAPLPQPSFTRFRVGTQYAR
ncbi:putative MFS family arabinose efflux permease [Buttiauxella sp. BIGb0552]|nr:putative MFS family arabinose efflux permease [Buttiauxella sp. BIGb0552]